MSVNILLVPKDKFVISVATTDCDSEFDFALTIFETLQSQGRSHEEGSETTRTTSLDHSSAEIEGYIPVVYQLLLLSK